MIHFLLIMLGTGLAVIVGLGSVIGLLMLAVGRMHEGHGTDWDERL